jgi:hypothetical protein
MVTVAQLRRVLDELDTDDAEVIVELPGAFRPVDGISVRHTETDEQQLIVLADL